MSELENLLKNTKFEEMYSLNSLLSLSKVLKQTQKKVDNYIEDFSKVHMITWDELKDMFTEDDIRIFNKYLKYSDEVSFEEQFNVSFQCIMGLTYATFNGNTDMVYLNYNKLSEFLKMVEAFCIETEYDIREYQCYVEDFHSLYYNGEMEFHESDVSKNTYTIDKETNYNYGAPFGSIATNSFFMLPKLDYKLKSSGVNCILVAKEIIELDFAYSYKFNVKITLTIDNKVEFIEMEYINEIEMNSY